MYHPPRSEIKITSIIAIIVGILCIFLYTITRWLTKTFGDISFEQLLWNITNPAIGSDINIIKSLCKILLKSILLATIWALLVIKLEDVLRYLIIALKKPKELFNKIKYAITPKHSNIYYSISFLAISLIALSILINKTNNNLKVSDFIKNEVYENSSRFIDENYYIPSKNDLIFNKKNNVVLILSESLETSFFDPKVSKQPISSKLFPLLEKGISNTNMVQGYGNSWTIAALTGWHFGLPLKLPPLLANNYHSYRGFLPNAKSIFDIFHEHGYRTVLLLGSDSNFSNQKTLFKDHGNFEIYDLNYWKESGWSLLDFQGTGWGYSDQFLLERAKEKYTELSSKNEPFILLIETIDTHAPSGYCPPEAIQYGDIRDSMAEADRLLSNFYFFITKNNPTNTVFSIIGDHYFMGNPSYLKNSERRIFNAFWGPLPQAQTSKLQQSFTCMDIAPTLLHVAGAKWPNYQFGLGISLFSEEATLSEKMGIDKLSEELAKNSHKYNQFY